jgi:hypothetical protein
VPGLVSFNCKKVFIVITEFTLKLLLRLVLCSTKQKLFPYDGPTLYSGWVLVSSDLKSSVAEMSRFVGETEPRHFFVLPFLSAPSEASERKTECE